ncbi:Mur ligase family protein, partial [Staphylococcus epidermidis]|uniref:Mur ligase family protein n=1 Tax=Staphylococcus epidermidis TaxID=1282 RepID=UPI0037DA12C9
QRNQPPIISLEHTLIPLHQFPKPYLNHLNPNLIPLTPSNPKTTTKHIIQTLLSTQFKVNKTQPNYNNQIPIPFTLLQLHQDTQISILEIPMSPFHQIHFLS